VVGGLAVQVLGVLWATRNEKVVVPVLPQGDEEKSHAE